MRVPAVGGRAVVGLRCVLEATAKAWGIATLLGAVAFAVGTAADLESLWLSPTGLPRPLERGLVAVAAAGVLGAGRLPAWARGALRGLVALGALGAMRDAVAYAGALGDGRFRTSLGIPASGIVAAVLLAWSLFPASSPPPGRGRRLAGACGVAAAGMALVLAQIATFGATDYRAPADAAVVFGSRVQADGRPSRSLLDRTVTACALWRAGLVRTLVLSGGRAADAPCSEPEAMRRIAVREGVPESALVLDETGVDTAATVRTAVSLAAERGWGRVLLVSHDYHLARIHLLARAAGLSARTVPAEETCPPGWKARFVAREVAAFVVAWLAPNVRA